MAMTALTSIIPCASTCRPRILFVVDTAGAAAAASGDGMIAGADVIHGGPGDNIIIGDFGFITEARTNPAQDPRLLSTANVTDVQTTLGYGAGDTIDAGDGNNIILGGFWSDSITAGNGANRIAGDNGDFMIANGIATYITTTDTTARRPAAATSSPQAAGNNIVLGGVGADRITLGGGSNVVIGDNGNATFTTAGVLTYATTSGTSLGGNDIEISTTGSGNNVVLGGLGATPSPPWAAMMSSWATTAMSPTRRPASHHPGRHQRSRFRRQRHHQCRRRQ